jgi:hypothetical protein
MMHVAESLRDSLCVSERRPHVVRSLRDRDSRLGETRPRGLDLCFREVRPCDGRTTSK